MQKIDLDGVDNARDFGGTATVDGRVVRPGVLIRSNHLAALSERDIRCLFDSHHLTKIIDLRTDREVLEKPDKEIAGVEWRHIPLFEESAVGITHEQEADLTMVLGAMPDMAALYRRIVTDAYSVSQLSRVFEEIMGEEDGAVLWHCTEGKDRCGIVSALTLELLGVERETIFADYLATNQASGKRADVYERMVLEKTGDRMMAKKVRQLFVADSSYLQAAFDAIEQEAGSVEAFLENQLGISGGQRERFCRRCLI